VPERIARVVLGCGNFGGIGSAPEFFGQGEREEEAFALMDAAWELGMRWFDTADAYGGGRSETAIGKWIKATGNRPRLTTKTFNPMTAGGDSGLARDRIMRQIETSLERLGVETVDLYLAHEFDPDTPLEESMTAFDELVERRLAGAYGVSNVDTEQLGAALEAGRPSYVQNSYSLLDRHDDAEVISLCAARGIKYQAYSPLAGGWLTGKYRRGASPPAGSRMTMRPGPYRHLDDERVYDGLDRFARAGAEHGVSTAALALAWVLDHPDVDSIVVGPRRPEHLAPVTENVRLSVAERKELTSLFSE
jgi:aryl-alcohol dehydrogenase-like predicted oxidoreductase